jgi:hypothetical protein
MIRRNSTRFTNIVPVAVVATMLLVGSFASAAQIKFDDGFNTQTGVLGFDADAGVLYGIDIVFYDVFGQDGTLDDVSNVNPPYACSSCTLNFAVSATHNGGGNFTIHPAGPVNEMTLHGEVSTITAADIDLLYGGEFASSTSDVSGSSLQFTGKGYDFKDADLVAHYFASPPPQFQFTLEISQNPIDPSQPPPPFVLDNGADLEIWWELNDAQLTNAPRVPEPTSALLMLLGLSSLVVARRRKL